MVNISPESFSRAICHRMIIDFDVHWHLNRAWKEHSCSEFFKKHSDLINNCLGIHRLALVAHQMAQGNRRPPPDRPQAHQQCIP